VQGESNTTGREQAVCKHDHLGLCEGGVLADQFHAELPELPVSPFLWPFVPETISEIKPAKGFCERFPHVHVETLHRCSDLGSEGKPPAALVLEDIHLIEYPLTRTDFEKFQFFERRGADLPVTP